MDITGTHHFDRPMADVFAAYLDPDSHVARFEGMGHRNIKVKSVEQTDDSLAITIARDVDIDVPGVAKKFLNPTNHVTSIDRWQLEDGVPTSRSKVELKGVPVDSSALATLTPDADGKGCTYEVTVSVKVKVPLVGEKIANALKGQLSEQIEAEFTVADAWLADH
jgi:carbon monoxide dehydrogenase subunit G